MTEPKIKSSITRAIDVLSNIESGHPNREVDVYAVRQAIADLKAFKEALPDDLAENIADYDSYFPTKEYGYPAAIGAAKLTAEAISDV